jgi:hypothetical protein
MLPLRLADGTTLEPDGRRGNVRVTGPDGCVVRLQGADLEDVAAWLESVSRRAREGRDRVIDLRDPRPARRR